MTPKEKANELVNKFLLATPIGFHIEDAKKCALIAVDEIISLKHPHIIVYSGFENNVISEMTQEYYWKQVKLEIEKL